MRHKIEYIRKDMSAIEQPFSSEPTLCKESALEYLINISVLTGTTRLVETDEPGSDGDVKMQWSQDLYAGSYQVLVYQENGGGSWNMIGCVQQTKKGLLFHQSR